MPSDLPGKLTFDDYKAFNDVHAKMIVSAGVAQERLRRTLDRVGVPGAVRWDPHAGELELRGRVFQAEALGSFNGSTWLWSWANDALGLPEARMAIGRQLRDAAERHALRLLATAEMDGDEMLAYKIGDFAVAYGYADAYYLVNQSVVYLIKRGQLDELEDRLGVLRAALQTIQAGTQRANFPLALLIAAKQLDLTVVHHDGDCTIADPAAPDEASIEVSSHGAMLEPIAICFTPEPVAVTDLVAPLLEEDSLAVLAWHEIHDGSIDLSAEGYIARVTPIEGADAVRREAVARLGADRAAGFRGAYVIRAGLRQGYEGRQHIVHDPAQLLGAASTGAMRGWVPAAVLEATGGRALSRPFPEEALVLCDCLKTGRNQVFDLGLGRVYER